MRVDAGRAAPSARQQGASTVQGDQALTEAQRLAAPSRGPDSRGGPSPVREGNAERGYGLAAPSETTAAGGDSQASGYA